MRLHEVFWPNKYLLTAVGLWPLPSDSTLLQRLFALLRYIVATFTMFTFFLTLLMTIVAHWGDINILGDYGGLAILHCLATFKLLYYLSRQQSVASMYKRIKDFWEVGNDPAERQSYERMAYVAKLVTIVCFLAGGADLLSFDGSALFRSMKYRRETNESLRHRPLPMELYYGIDTQRTPTYEMIFAWQTICMLFSVLSVIACDCTAMVFIIHVSGHFKLISARFRAIGRKIDEPQTVEKLHLEAEIGECIARHQHALRVTKELNALLSPVMFCQIMSSGLQICLSGYTVIEGENGGVELAKFVAFFISLLLELVIYCAPAELLIQESLGIADSVYFHMPWFRLTPSRQRDLKFVVMRAQRECHVTALYQVMSVRRLTEVFNAAGSYMALLRSMKK